MFIPDAPKYAAIKPLNILHTSDWHLGRRLYGRLRYDEFESFLQWLQDTISAQKVDILIVAGDIFDTMTPSNKAQALYYEFLGKVSKSCCQHVVIVAGNHDSPTFLDAPSNVLKFLNVHVIGTACEDVSDEVLVLEDKDNHPHCIIAAVPYLRDRDVRSTQAGESAQTKDANVIAGIRAHYDKVADIAKTAQAELIKTHHRHIPIIATGHLFAAGGKTTDDDGVRELYVGSLGKISADMFDDSFDYVALGHLHVPQRVGGCAHIRYSGSPIAMGFGETHQQKQVLLIQFGVVADENAANPLSVEPITASVPIKETVKKTVKQTTAFMDDLFGFDEPVEDNELAKNNTKENTIDQQDEKIQLTPTDMIASNKTANEVLHQNLSSQMQVTSLPIPTFQQLAQISGDLTTISQKIKSLTQTDSIWLEVVYTGDEIVSGLKDKVNEMVEGTVFEVLITKDSNSYNKVLNQQQTSETLQDLNELEVFERCLTTHNVSDEQKPTLRDAYEQIVYNLRHEDKRA